MKKYQQIKEQRKNFVEKLHPENNDCGVIATALLCRVSYRRAHKACATNGRNKKQGMYQNQIRAAIKSLGYDLERVPHQMKDGKAFSPRSVVDKYDKGYYLCITASHFFALINGIVEDWTVNRQHRITYIFKITKAK